MIKGIEILNQITLTKPNPNCAFIIPGIFMFWMILLIIGLIMDKSLSIGLSKKAETYIAMVIASAIVSFVITIPCSFIIKEIYTIPSGKYQYQVIMDENVDMNEFHNEYNVIKQEGKIYTIEYK